MNGNSWDLWISSQAGLVVVMEVKIGQVKSVCRYTFHVWFDLSLCWFKPVPDFYLPSAIHHPLIIWTSAVVISNTSVRSVNTEKVDDISKPGWALDKPCFCLAWKQRCGDSGDTRRSIVKRVHDSPINPFKKLLPGVQCRAGGILFQPTSRLSA